MKHGQRRPVIRASAVDVGDRPGQAHLTRALQAEQTTGHRGRVGCGYHVVHGRCVLELEYPVVTGNQFVPAPAALREDGEDATTDAALEHPGQVEVTTGAPAGDQVVIVG